jgi:hypothetical protein
VAKYRKAIYLDVTPKKRGGKEGYEVTTELGVVSWKEKVAFERTYILCKAKKKKKPALKPAAKPTAPKTETKKTVAKK